MTTPAPGVVEGFANPGSTFVLVGLISTNDFAPTSSNATPVPAPTSVGISVQMSTSTAPFSALHHAASTIARRQLRSPQAGFNDGQAPRWRLLPHISVTRAARLTTTSIRARRETFSLGQTKTFYLGYPSSGPIPSQTYTLAAISTHGYIWVDTNLTNVTTTAAQQFGSAFDTAYTSDTTHFASADYQTSSPGYVANSTQIVCDSNGTVTGTGPQFAADSNPGMIDVLLTSSQNPQALSFSYFDYYDFFDQAAVNCSAAVRGSGNAWQANGLPIIHIAVSPTGGPIGNFVPQLLPAIQAHELQHLINWVNHFMLHSNVTGYETESTWINEGLARLAQDLALGTGHIDADDNVGADVTPFLNAPQDCSLTYFACTNGGVWQGNCAACYGDAYLMMRWLYDRFGDNFTHAELTSGNFGSANLAAATSTYATFPSLLQDYVTMLTVGNNAQIPHSSKFDLQAFSLHGSVTGYIGTYTLTGPAASNTIQPDGSFSMQFNQGGFAFIKATGMTGTGNAIKVTDTSGGTLNLTGAVGQH